MNLPVYIEQMISGFFGRGMLTTETINLVTEQDISAASAAGSRSISVTDGTKFKVAGSITVKHDNGRYWSYFINAISGNVVTVAPGLRWPVASGNRCERTWFNRAHPGKFYMRQLAQRVAFASERDNLPRYGRTYFTQFKTDVLTAVGSAGVSYFGASSSNTADVNAPARFVVGRTAYVDVSAAGQGAKITSIAVPKQHAAELRLAALAGHSHLAISVQIADHMGNVFAEHTLPTRSKLDPLEYYKLPFSPPPWATSLAVQVVAKSLSSASFFLLADLSVYGVDSAADDNIIPSETTDTIVVCGDSWASGDLTNTLEREPIGQQLALELPNATVINAGGGGRRIWEMNAAFDAEVAVHSPNFVVVSEGTNEAYNPSSSTFEPTAVDYFVAQMQTFMAKCQRIGARPIILGPPALAESDTGFSSWSLNARAIIQNERLFEKLVRAA